MKVVYGPRETYVCSVSSVLRYQIHVRCRRIVGIFCCDGRSGILMLIKVFFNHGCFWIWNIKQPIVLNPSINNQSIFLELSRWQKLLCSFDFLLERELHLKQTVCNKFDFDMTWLIKQKCLKIYRTVFLHCILFCNDHNWSERYSLSYTDKSFYCKSEMCGLFSVLLHICLAYTREEWRQFRPNMSRTRCWQTPTIHLYVDLHCQPPSIGQEFK